jgi:hypothetical protein
VSTTLIGTLVEIRDTFLVLDQNTHIMLPPGLKVKDLVEPEHEEEMSDGRTLRFHVACDGLWRVLKGTLPPTT